MRLKFLFKGYLFGFFNLIVDLVASYLHKVAIAGQNLLAGGGIEFV